MKMVIHNIIYIQTLGGTNTNIYNMGNRTLNPCASHSLTTEFNSSEVYYCDGQPVGLHVSRTDIKFLGHYIQTSILPTFVCYFSHKVH